MHGDGDRDYASFDQFVLSIEPRLHGAFVASYGHEHGREATAEALAYAWETWPKLESLENPAAYLYKVGQSRTRRRRIRPVFDRPTEDDPRVEPGLSPALSKLSIRQRQTVGLIYGEGWTLQEVAQFLGISISSVQKHAERGLGQLRRRLGVGVEETIRD